MLGENNGLKSNAPAGFQLWEARPQKSPSNGKKIHTKDMCWKDTGNTSRASDDKGRSDVDLKKV